MHSPARHGAQHVALFVRRCIGDAELDTAVVDDRRTGDAEHGQRVFAPVPAGDDELQVMTPTGVDLPPAAGRVGQVGVARAVRVADEDFQDVWRRSVMRQVASISRKGKSDARRHPRSGFDGLSLTNWDCDLELRVGRTVETTFEAKFATWRPVGDVGRFSGKCPRCQF